MPIQVVTTVFGEPGQTSEAIECPTGPMAVTSWSIVFATNTADPKFIGWSTGPGLDPAALTTFQGVSIGTMTKTLEATYAIEIFESSLGIEFNVDQMSGLLSDATPKGVITDLWAGTNCIFR